MLKFLEALVIFLGGHLLTNAQGRTSDPSSGLDFILSKSRGIALFLVGAITLPLLWVSSLMLTVVGIANWLGSTDPLRTYTLYTFFGLGLFLLSSVAAVFGLSKKRFEVKPEESTPRALQTSVHASSQLEQILVNMIKEFMKPSPPSTAEEFQPPSQRPLA